jgi:hypothetical protein
LTKGKAVQSELAKPSKELSSLNRNEDIEQEPGIIVDQYEDEYILTGKEDEYSIEEREDAIVS